MKGVGALLKQTGETQQVDEVNEVAETRITVLPVIRLWLVPVKMACHFLCVIIESPDPMAYSIVFYLYECVRKHGCSKWSAGTSVGVMAVYQIAYDDIYKSLADAHSGCLTRLWRYSLSPISVYTQQPHLFHPPALFHLSPRPDLSPRPSSPLLPRPVPLPCPGRGAYSWRPSTPVRPQRHCEHRRRQQGP